MWTQSVTRTRWLATKLIVTGLAAMAAVGVLSLVMTWWAGSLDKAINAGQEQNGLFGVARIAPPLFEARGITPIAYTAFALVLGVGDRDGRAPRRARDGDHARACSSPCRS